MQCSCGGSTTNQSHVVKTLEKAREWFPDVTEADLPVTVDRDVCGACGRERRRMYKAQSEEATEEQLSLL